MASFQNGPFIVTGASGQLGRQVIDQLIEAGAGPIIAVTRNADKLAEFRDKGVDVRQGDFNAPETLGPAIAGGKRILIISTDDLEPGEFSRVVAAQGGTDNAFTASDYTGYFQRVAADRLGLMMEMEADRMRDLQLDELDPYDVKLSYDAEGKNKLVTDHTANNTTRDDAAYYDLYRYYYTIKPEHLAGRITQVIAITGVVAVLDAIAATDRCLVVGRLVVVDDRIGGFACGCVGGGKITRAIGQPRERAPFW